MNNTLLKSIKKLIHETNEDLVKMAEEDGFTGDSRYDDGYADALRENVMNLLELVKEYEY